MAQRRLPAGPLLEVAVEGTNSGDKDALIGALEAVAEQDSSFAFSYDAESGQTILKGMSETHLERIAHALQRMLGDEVDIGAVQVAYRERISKTAEIDYTHKEQIGGAGQFARVRVRFEPAEPGSDGVFASVAAGALRDAFVAAALKGLRASFDNGVSFGFPIIDSRATLIDGAYHETDSDELVFEIAARAAFRMLKDKGVVALLEPVMAVEVVTPNEFVGAVSGDLAARRGLVQDTQHRDDVVVMALVPLAGMLGYEKRLTAMTKGHGRFTMRFDHYDVVPGVLGGGPDLFPQAAALRA